MSLKNILNLAKGNEEEKVAMSLKVPASLKKRLETFSKENGVSVNSLINAMIVNGFEDIPILKEYYLELYKLECKMETYLLPEEAGGEYYRGYFINPGVIIDNSHMQVIDNIITRLSALKKLIED